MGNGGTHDQTNVDVTPDGAAHITGVTAADAQTQLQDDEDQGPEQADLDDAGVQADDDAGVEPENAGVEPDDDVSVGYCTAQQAAASAQRPHRVTDGRPRRRSKGPTARNGGSRLYMHVASYMWESLRVRPTDLI